MKTVIDKNVPVPAIKAKSKYPWSQMKVGDSFLTPNEDIRKTYSAVSARNQRFPDTHFIVRAVEGGMRVWRDK